MPSRARDPDFRWRRSSRNGVETYETRYLGVSIRIQDLTGLMSTDHAFGYSVKELGGTYSDFADSWDEAVYAAATRAEEISDARDRRNERSGQGDVPLPESHIEDGAYVDFEAGDIVRMKAHEGGGREKVQITGERGGWYTFRLLSPLSELSWLRDYSALPPALMAWGASMLERGGKRYRLTPGRSESGDPGCEGRLITDVDIPLPEALFTQEVASAMTPEMFGLLLAETDENLLAKLKTEVQQKVEAKEINNMIDLLDYVRPIFVFRRPMHRVREVVKELQAWYVTTFGPPVDQPVWS